MNRSGRAAVDAPRDTPPGALALRASRQRCAAGLRPPGRYVLLAAVVSFLAGAAPGADRVILISLDGLRPDAISPQSAPNITALQLTGRQAADALNDLPVATMTNHATMLTGLIAAQHGLLLNTSLPGTIDRRTLFDFAASAGRRCAFFASKSKLAFLAHPDALETIQINGDMDALAASVLAEIRADGPDLIFVHLRDPDSTGHSFGWMSPEYLSAVQHSDALVGAIVAAADADDSRPTYFLVTADHGGEGTTHFLNTPETRRIPWIIAGPDIPAGHALDRAISIADTTPTLLWLLDVPIPPGLSGRAVTEVKTAAAEGESAQPVSPIVPVSLPCIVLVIPPAAGLVGLAWLVQRAGRRPADRCRRPRR